ncbi:MAG TPA: hypothetical protein VF666_10205 [Pyrinomonadaceae bacterium]|jgi:ATP-dependent protease ClpP protease subunit
MDNSKFQTEIHPILVDCQKLLDRASALIGGNNAVVLVETEGMYPDLVYAFHKLVRKLPPGNGIDVILHSFGGTTDAASSIASLCKERFGSFRVIVPFQAKSAATLLALAADDRLLPCSAQFGPVDPQVRHPEKGMWFPAHSIKEALDKVEATKDAIVKMAMADKLDPLLIGAYQDAISASKQYIEEVVEGWTSSDKDTIVSTFVDKYKSHGYPIGRTMLRAINAPFTPIDGETEEVVCDLHEKCFDLIDDDEALGAIILTKEEYFFRLGDFKESGKFSTVHAPSAITQPAAQPRQASAAAQ